MAKCNAHRPEAPTRTRKATSPLVGILEEEMKLPNGLFIVALSNRANLLAHCGHGVGTTHETAKDDALRLARDRDPNATYDAELDIVTFWEVPCL